MLVAVKPDPEVTAAGQSAGPASSRTCQAVAAAIAAQQQHPHAARQHHLPAALPVSSDAPQEGVLMPGALRNSACAKQQGAETAAAAGAGANPGAAAVAATAPCIAAGAAPGGTSPSHIAMRL